MGPLRGPVTKTIGPIELYAVLGQGAFGKVYLGYDTQKKEEVAVKVIEKKLIVQFDLQEYVEREIEVLKRLKHPHVVTLKWAITSNKGHYLVMELANNGELFDRIVESKRFPEATSRRYFQQLVSAVQYCHDMGIVHRDLKAENLLLGREFELKVCDFGLSRFVSSAKPQDPAVVFTSLAGSLDYQAPEVLKEQGYQGFSCDVWSCGAILYFMVCGFLPFAADSEQETRRRILNAQYQKPQRFSDGLVDLLDHIFVVDPNQRYSISQIIDHPWFQVDLQDLSLPHLQSLGSSPTTPGPDFGRVMENTHNVELMNYREKLHAAFSSLNVNHSGYLTKTQIKDMLVKVLESPISDCDVDEFVKNFEHDDEGRILEEQFVHGWTRNHKQFDDKICLNKLIDLFHFDLEKELLDDLRKAFDKLDLEKNGVLTRDDIRVVADSLGVSPSDREQLSTLMCNGKEKVPFEAFVAFCTTGDVLKTNPIAHRLTKLCEMFDVSESMGYKSFITTGFTVEGHSGLIMAKLIERGPNMSTLYNQGEMEGFLYGRFQVGGKTVLLAGVQLLPACAGYTKVLAYRIQGKTNVFHEWFRSFRRCLMDEIIRCEEDSSTVGDSELV